MVGKLNDALFSISAATFLFNQFETLGLVPAEWRRFRQAHIPKEDREDDAIDVASLRPISVSSVWYRLWAGTRFRSPGCTAWIDRW